METPATGITVGEQPTEPPPEPPGVRKPMIEMSVEELVAKSIVPVKKEFWSTARVTSSSSDYNSSSNDVVPKSKRQLKRERNQVVLLFLICVYLFWRYAEFFLVSFYGFNYHVVA